MLRNSAIPQPLFWMSESAPLFWPLFSGHVEQTVRVVGEKIKRICSVKLPHLVFVANSNMACKKSKTRFRIQIMVLPPLYCFLPP
jgi:hypothetical protein